MTMVRISLRCRIRTAIADWLCNFDAASEAQPWCQGAIVADLRQVAGAWPTSFLNARLKAASDS